MSWNPEDSKQRIQHIEAPTDQPPAPSPKTPARWSKTTMQPLGNVTVFGRSSLNKKNNGPGTTKETNQSPKAEKETDQDSSQESKSV